MKITGKRSLSSRRWLDRQMNDPFVKRAKQEGYRSRAAYKLIEIDDKFKFIKNAKKIVDLGAAPGGWSQLLAERSNEALIVAMDLLDFNEIDGVKQFIGDFESETMQESVIEYLDGKVNLIVSDMAPSTIGHAQTDHLRIMRLVEGAYYFAQHTLEIGGAFVAKLFQGGEEKQFLEKLRPCFKKVCFFKPKSSRSLSVEIYIVAVHFLGDDL